MRVHERLLIEHNDRVDRRPRLSSPSINSQVRGGQRAAAQRVGSRSGMDLHDRGLFNVAGPAGGLRGDTLRRQRDAGDGVERQAAIRCAKEAAGSGRVFITIETCWRVDLAPPGKVIRAGYGSLCRVSHSDAEHREAAFCAAANRV